ncbi:hypothetical protein SJI00_05940 [Pseudomonas sp. RP23018S]|uniref:hypothetical protein n=1 Tax=Pseudomonas sp. RP23018S TaxID=3096037 RepID=UPI002ACAFD58|nr:hypothetical protein [Pseudomonas sp. RP23018S]MDZ5602306.1 hypothetical protein [Pseudomonas sp. RP23018S]
MNDQYAPTQSSDDGEPPFVYLNQQMLSRLAEASLAVPNCIPVMLMLVSEARADGSIELSSLEFARQCELTLKRLTAAIFGLAGAGLIENFNVRASLEGRILCQVSSTLVSREVPVHK